jgi:hypothetical protein
MLPAPLEHRFTLDGEPYHLVEWTRGQERRIRAWYIEAIAPNPAMLENLDGADLYVEAVARECLREAPGVWWQDVPAPAGQNGTPGKVFTTERVPRALWVAFRKEADLFLGLLFPDAPAVLDRPDAGRRTEPDAVAPLEVVPAVFRGRAE